MRRCAATASRLSCCRSNTSVSVPRPTNTLDFASATAGGSSGSIRCSSSLTAPARSCLSITLARPCRFSLLGLDKSARRCSLSLCSLPVITRTLNCSGRRISRRGSAGRRRALGFFDGAPALVVPDNLEAGVKTASWYEPELNRTYAEWAALWDGDLAGAAAASATIDWTVKESVRAKLRTMVRRILRKYGYPPDKQERATLTVLEQAELLSKEWAA